MAILVLRGSISCCTFQTAKRLKWWVINKFRQGSAAQDFGPSSRGLQYDIKNRKTFLKRCRYEDITADMLYIGAVVTIYSRQLKIVDYADEYTSKCLSNKQERYTLPELLLQQGLGML